MKKENVVKIAKGVALWGAIIVLVQQPTFLPLMLYYAAAGLVIIVLREFMV